MIRFRSLLSVFFIMFFYSQIITLSFAADEKKLVSSADRLLQEWKKMISNGYYPLMQDSNTKMWSVMRASFVEGSGAYDIKKTESIVTPHVLTLSFQIVQLGSNTFSPNANGSYSNIFKRISGFKTQEEALDNLKESDFLFSKDNQFVEWKGKGLIYNIICYYAFQNNNWILKGGNDDYLKNFYLRMDEKLNSKYFKNLMSFPVK
jgi:hypothetical protein